MWAVIKLIKSVPTKFIFEFLKWDLDEFTHCFMQDMNAFNLQLHMQI